VCIALCTIVAHDTAQNRPDNFSYCPPDNHHCSDDVYVREEATTVPIISPLVLQTVIIVQMLSVGGEGSGQLWKTIQEKRNLEAGFEEEEVTAAK